ncbi:MAG TPA: hypothetical protein VMY06_01060 [Sedimentisphaerales bacterium]|nr:hypothetical protein [Sedimentisphaerales bacterium]
MSCLAVHSAEPLVEAEVLVEEEVVPVAEAVEAAVVEAEEMEVEAESNSTHRSIRT